MQGATRKPLAEVILKYAPLRATSSALEDSTPCLHWTASFVIKEKIRFELGAGGY